jgi:hypothetical protein
MHNIKYKLLVKICPVYGKLNIKKLATKKLDYWNHGYCIHKP